MKLSEQYKNKDPKNTYTVDGEGEMDQLQELANQKFVDPIDDEMTTNYVSVWFTGKEDEVDQI